VADAVSAQAKVLWGVQFELVTAEVAYAQRGALLSVEPETVSFFLERFESALDYAKNRVQFSGKPIAAHQLVQAKFAEMQTQMVSSQLMALEAARLKEEKKLRPAQISMIKRHNVRAALEAARMCRDILGGNGITLEYPVMRHMCNLETVYTYEGTHDIHTLVLGQDITGIAAYD
jgi:alkylation response protein AidB-like acyl-CoA dehydrogenase